MRLKRVNDTINKLRQLAERWDDRLVLEGFPLTKLYLDGRIAIAPIMDVSGGAKADISGFLNDGSISGGNSANSESSPCRDRRRILFLFLADADDNVIGNNDGGHKDAVLIHSVKLIESVEQRITPTLVRFYGVSDY